MLHEIEISTSAYRFAATTTTTWALCHKQKNIFVIAYSFAIGFWGYFLCCYFVWLGWKSEIDHRHTIYMGLIFNYGILVCKLIEIFNPLNFKSCRNCLPCKCDATPSQTKSVLVTRNLGNHFVQPDPLIITFLLFWWHDKLFNYVFHFPKRVKIHEMGNCINMHVNGLWLRARRS